MNFKAPRSYDYVDGAWKGADPPHLQPQVIIIIVVKMVYFTKITLQPFGMNKVKN